MEWVKNWLEHFHLLLSNLSSDPLHILTTSLSTEYISYVCDSIWKIVMELPLVLQWALTVFGCIVIIAITTSLYMKLTKGICKSNVRLDGKTVLITGANSGIGLETARDFAQRGARVILAVRNMEKGIDAAKDIMRTTRTNNLVVRKLDLACLEEIRKFAQQINDGEKRLDILVLNAGIAGINRKYLTEENLELHMVSNHFGHFLLTNLLLPLLCESSIIKDRPSTDPVRIVVVSSVMHWYGKIEFDNLNSEKHFNPARIYNDTKLANLLFTFEMSRKLKKEGFNNVIVNAVHPGPVQTNLFHNLNYLGLIIKFLVGLLYYSPKVNY